MGNICCGEENAPAPMRKIDAPLPEINIDVPVLTPKKKEKSSFKPLTRGDAFQKFEGKFPFHEA